MSKPEDVVYEEWRKYSKLAGGARTTASRQAYQAIADTIQYLLQDWSAYGRDLVWGSNALHYKKKSR